MFYLVNMYLNYEIRFQIQFNIKLKRSVQLTNFTKEENIENIIVLWKLLKTKNTS